MSNYRTKAIVLRRTNYGEADRILQLITPEQGKVSAIAKGVRREKSKLAGGIELFAVCDLTIRIGRSDMGTVTSSRLEHFYGHIIEDYDRMQLGYEAIKLINRVSESVTEPAFYELLHQMFMALDDLDVPISFTEAWFRLQLSILLGVGLNLTTDANGMKLVEDSRYDFDEMDMAFVYRPEGRFSTDHIKLLRLLSGHGPQVAAHVKGGGRLIADCLYLARRAYSS